jgi:predicted RNA-binding Zn-ribbon protein involved in translation (DUF1610 family)
MSNMIECHNCKKLISVEWDVWTKCPFCGEGQTWRHSLTPEEIIEQRK